MIVHVTARLREFTFECECSIATVSVACIAGITQATLTHVTPPVVYPRTAHMTPSEFESARGMAAVIAIEIAAVEASERGETHCTVTL